MGTKPLDKDWEMFLEQAYDDYHSSLDPDLDEMDQWEMMKDFVKETIIELEGEFDPILAQSLIHAVWNIIYPETNWVHITYDTNAFGWGKHHIMPFMLYDQWLFRHERINLENGIIDDMDLITIIGSFERVKKESITRSAFNKNLKNKFDDWR